MSSGRRRSLLKRLIRRDKGRCRLCDREVRRYSRFNDERIPDDQATVEHWPVPRRLLPIKRWYDDDCVILACFGCNQAQDGTMVPLDQLAPAEAIPQGSVMAEAFARARAAPL